MAQASAAVSEHRLWRRHLDMARLGATPKGGVKRLALTDLDNRARALLVEWGRALGLAPSMDAIGNLFLRREGSERAAPPVLSGSHTDTQPSGGRFDGIYGVLAAFEALEAMRDAGIATRRPVEACVWTCEEGGARFPRGTVGSSVFAGALALDDALAIADDAGVSMRASMEATQALLRDVPERAVGFPIAAFVEAHIEQGPVLEAEGLPIGVVTAIQGARRFRVEVEGEDGHAGTVPRRARKDAVQAAVRMVAALDQLFLDPEDIVRFTVGRFRATPDAVAVIPGHVMFTVDFRHPDNAVLKRLGDQVRPLCEQARGPCEVTVVETGWTAPVTFTPLVPEAVAAAARHLGLKSKRMLSGAGHDAMMIARAAPSGMIFVPCERGISHNEAENAKPEDLAAGARVLADVLVDLANG